MSALLFVPEECTHSRTRVLATHTQTERKNDLPLLLIVSLRQQLAAAGTRYIHAERDFSFVDLSKYFVFAEHMQQVCSKKIEKN